MSPKQPKEICFLGFSKLFSLLLVLIRKEKQKLTEGSYGFWSREELPYSEIP